MIYFVTKTYLAKKISEWMEVIAYKMAAQAKANMEQLRSEMEAITPEITYCQSVTYAQLVQLRNQSNLVPGTWYKMIDYVTKVANDPEARSAGHPFDLLLLATSENTISEHARAIRTTRNAGSYFRNSNLSAWQIWYCLDNDYTRFMWASSTGTGVIYRLIDEFGNDCAYDFKNVQYKRYAVSDNNAGDGEFELDLDGLYMGYQGDMYNLSIPDESDYIYCYTFNSYDEERGVSEDASLSVQVFSSSVQDTGNYNQRGCLQNVIKPYYAPVQIDDLISFSAIALNNICYIYRNYSPDGGEHDACGIFGNRFETGCHSMSFRGNSRNDSFGEECKYIVAGYRLNDCTFSQGCCDMSFSQGCGWMSFSQYCNNMSFSQGCGNMSFSQNCYSMSFSQYCHDMSFSQGCGNMSFSQDCWNMSFSQHCYDMSFSQYCNNISVGAGVYGISLPESARNIHILSGVNGSQESYLKVDVEANYTQLVAMDSNGNIRIFNPADAA